MTIQPRDVDEIYESLRDRITGKTAKLTNFAETSFNYVWTRGWSRDIQEQEEQTLAALLAAWPDYAGKELTEDDMEALGIEYEPDEINEYMDSQHLDELAKLVGESRFEGQKAKGKVTFQVSGDNVQIFEGVTIGTTPDANGEFLSFRVDADGDGEIDEESDASVSPDPGESEVTVDIVAEEVGTEYNVGAGQITFLPSPPVGVLGAANETATSGGLDVQSDADFREDIKTAVTRTSGGGTVAGVAGFISNNVDGVNNDSVLVQEFVEQNPPFANVVVDGGSDQEVLDAIDQARPVGIQHNLVRPAIYQLRINSRVSGSSSINTGRIEDEIEEYILSLQLGENFLQDKIIQRVFNADVSVDNITYLDTTVSTVLNEFNEYGQDDIYRVGYPYGEGGLSREITDEEDNTYQKGVDYVETSVTPSGNLNGIDWGVGGDSPQQGVEFLVDYYMSERFTFTDSSAKYTTNGTPTSSSVVTDVDGNEYDASAYTFNDTDGDGYNDEIEWTDTSVISDTSPFFLNYGEEKEIDLVSEEEIVFDNTKDVYELEYTVQSSDEDDTIEDDNGNTYQQGQDYDFIDTDGDGLTDSIDWSVGGSKPSDGVVFYVTYRNGEVVEAPERYKIDPLSVGVNTE